jgi:hypothetical protein
MIPATCERTVARWRVVVWVLFGLLIVAHGCHADKDTELSGERSRISASFLLKFEDTGR